MTSVDGRPAEAGATTGADGSARLDALLDKLDHAIARLEDARPFAKRQRAGGPLDLARRAMAEPGGVEAVYDRIRRLEGAGVFHDTDWANPGILHASIAAQTLRLADPATATLEALSQLRMLAVSRGVYFHPGLSSEQAANFLAQTIGLNLDLLLSGPDEAQRSRPGQIGDVLRHLFAFIVGHVDPAEVVDQLIAEIWRLLAQRPIVVEEIKSMISQIAAWRANDETTGGAATHGRGGWGADRLISAVFAPTAGCREDPGLEVYGARLAAMDDAALAQEAAGLARSMHDTGLASAYHAVFLRAALDRAPTDFIGPALGLSATGMDAYRCYRDLVRALIERAVHPETAQAIYGLALMLERGVLYQPSVGPGLWRQIGLKLAPAPAERLRTRYGTARAPEDWLLAGVLSVLGQPLGVGQGNNPTCQAARALSMWAFADPDYLLQIVAWTARDDRLVMAFEGAPISSDEAAAGLAAQAPADVDPVSIVAAPHLDRIYAEMGRRCAERGGDAHRWVNPEMHGWWVGRGCALAVDVATGRLDRYEDFVRRFYAVYHPLHNGGQPVIHPQPAGIAMTDAAARYVGWHAIAIYRVALDQEGVMRVYFYNPNNDSGQDWGDGVVVSTEGKGERFGESSLPIADFAARLYLFHYDPLEVGRPDSAPADEVAAIEAAARRSWAADR
ncbi:MAG: hypothetical protein NXI21_04210 [Alphaproteobacteria bacterium]|nr:hypothetical protein [Alphaproteobacteria bacterium]